MAVNVYLSTLKKVNIAIHLYTTKEIYVGNLYGLFSMYIRIMVDSAVVVHVAVLSCKSFVELWMCSL